MPRRSPSVTEGGRLVLLVAALLGSAAGLFVELGPLGVGVALLAVVVASAVEGVYGVGVLHLGIVAVGVTPSVVGIVLVEMASVFLLVGDVHPGHRLETGVLTIPLAVALAVGTATLATGRGVVTAAVVLVLVVGLGTYTIHRYGRVRLGLATGELEG